MDSLKNRDMAQILGLYSPWAIKDIELTNDADAIVIHLEKQADRSRFSFLPNQKKSQQVTRRWQHVRFGHVNSFIEATMTLDDLAEISESRPPAFLGAENKRITRELADTIRIAHSRQLNAEMISGLLGISSDVVEAEIREIETEEQMKQHVSLLPLESNPIWRDILTDKVKLSTRLLPLKLLLSRLKLEVSKNLDNVDVMQKSISELRGFFLRHAHQLTHEYELIGAKDTNEQTKSRSVKTKLVLPGTKNEIWHQLLAGEFDLNTQSMPLKLNLAQQRRAYASATDAQQRVDVIRKLQLFFKSNARTLIPELTILTQMLQAQQEQKVKLPPPDHTIWKDLLLDDQLLNSDKINYRLLLSRLKSSYRRNHDSSSIEQLHSFFSQNAQAMTDEIKIINSLAASR
ncbi:hypothetical protein [Reinekea blandensis]|uniref:Uncharacterized protein n=1 Tax=Reinekea blandensis MED297 TaxID=314283 RepID=A4B9U0_9GAMM|nr:hypothetical protein [Reinekea blandensis]EAR11391.1 hypothetical protein MED297_20927 [Reinekea sp. MED297] [Reinekea blandensis MED297]